jgi:hypothetical protein
VTSGFLSRTQRTKHLYRHLALSGQRERAGEVFDSLFGGGRQTREPSIVTLPASPSGRSRQGSLSAVWPSPTMAPRSFFGAQSPMAGTQAARLTSLGGGGRLAPDNLAAWASRGASIGIVGEGVGVFDNDLMGRRRLSGANRNGSPKDAAAPDNATGSTGELLSRLALRAASSLFHNGKPTAWRYQPGVACVFRLAVTV